LLQIGDWQIARFVLILEISTGTQYVTVHRKCWMRYSSQTKWIHWKAAVTLKKCTAFRVLDELRDSLINTIKTVKSYIDCSLFLIC
jgi:hypothetical protein